MSDEASELSREELLQRYGKKSTGAPASPRRSPFKFLDSYDASDADIFFGRDAEIAELMRHFHSYGHVLIYGESGSGKSSLVQCGLRSRISEADALFVPLRIHATGLPGLCDQIRESVSIAIQQPLEVGAGTNLVDMLRIAGEAASRPIVLFFDQFEELFIFHDAQTRQRLADDLASIPQAKLNVKVMIGVRQDFLAQLSELEDIVEGLFDNRFWLRRMSRENAMQAVVKACSTCDVGIVDNVAETILQRLDPGAQGVELPYLQVVMDRLFRQAVEQNPVHPVIASGDVEDLGDIANILGSFLVEEVAKLPSPDTGRQILKAFVTREATRRSLDRAALSQEAAGFGEAIPPDVLDIHLNQLVSARILREFAETGSYELRHDALAATVASWISEVEKELIEVRDNLINRFKEYEARGGQSSALLDQSFMDYLGIYRKRLGPLLDCQQAQYLQDSEKRLQRVKRFRQIVTAVGILAAFFILIAGWMYAQNEAEAKKAIAAAQRLEAVNDLLDLVDLDTLQDAPEMSGALANMGDVALNLFKEIGAPRDETSRYQLGMANFKVGQIHYRILSSGDGTKDAEAAYREAIVQLESLSSDFPDNAVYRQQLGSAHMWLGELFRETGSAERADEAMQHYNRAIEIQNQLVTQTDKNQFQIDLARSHMNRGIHRKNNARRKRAQDANGAKRDFEDAMHDYDQAESLLTKALPGVVSDEQNEACQILLSKTHLNRGLLQKVQLNKKGLDQDLFKDAKVSYVAALEGLKNVIDRRRMLELPERYNLELAKYHSNIANLLWEFDPDAKTEAKVHNAEALRLGKSLYLGTRQVRMELANFYFNKGWFLKNDDPKLAIEEFQNAANVLETLLKQNSDDQDAVEFRDDCIQEIKKAETKRSPVAG